jgi:hypothetical protein
MCRRGLEVVDQSKCNQLLIEMYWTKSVLDCWFMVYLSWDWRSDRVAFGYSVGKWHQGAGLIIVCIDDALCSLLCMQMQCTSLQVQFLLARAWLKFMKHPMKIESHDHLWFNFWRKKFSENGDILAGNKKGKVSCLMLAVVEKNGMDVMIDLFRWRHCTYFIPAYLQKLRWKEKEEKRELVLSETFGLMKNHTLKTNSVGSVSPKWPTICEKANQGSTLPRSLDIQENQNANIPLTKLLFFFTAISTGWKLDVFIIIMKRIAYGAKRIQSAETLFFYKNKTRSRWNVSNQFEITDFLSSADMVLIHEPGFENTCQFEVMNLLSYFNNNKTAKNHFTSLFSILYLVI